MKHHPLPHPATDRATPTEERLRLANNLYLRYSADILGFFRSTRRMARADAADLLQQTFSELLRTFARQEGLRLDNPRAFLFKIATRQLYALHRQALRRPELDDETDPTEIAAQDDLEYEASLRSEQRLVLRAMRRLPSDQRRGTPSSPEGVSQLQLLVYFRFWVGMTLTEVGQILDLSASAVAGRQRRALDKLQGCLEEIEQEAGGVPSTSTTVLMRWRDLLEREASVDRGELTPNGSVGE